MGDVAETGALDLEKFLRDYDFRGFISVCKSVAIVKHFATFDWATDTYDHDGWIYACFVEGGWEIPPVGTYTRPSGGTFKVPFAEQEITMPGRLDWDDVVGCRQVKQDGMFDGPVYLKPSLETDDPEASRQIYDLLSGKSQN